MSYPITQTYYTTHYSSGLREINKCGHNQQAMLYISLSLSFHFTLSLCLISYDSKEAVADQTMFLWCLRGATRGRCCTDTIQWDSIQLFSSVSPFMQGKTPSAPVVPGALTADQKNHPNSCCQTKAKQWGQQKVTHKFERERQSERTGGITHCSDERRVSNKSFTDYQEECSFQMRNS